MVPEKRYEVTPSFLQSIQDRGFEINVHDLNHDGHLFRDLDEFLHRADQINRYVREFRRLGISIRRDVPEYRLVRGAGCGLRHVHSQYGAHGSSARRLLHGFPFFHRKNLELPVTTTQDYSLFHILNDYSIRLWEQEVSLVREKHGLLSFIIHPDYVVAESRQRVYRDLLRYLAGLRAQGETWIALPGRLPLGGVFAAS